MTSLYFIDSQEENLLLQLMKECESCSGPFWWFFTNGWCATIFNAAAGLCGDTVDADFDSDNHESFQRLQLFALFLYQQDEQLPMLIS